MLTRYAGDSLLKIASTGLRSFPNNAQVYIAPQVVSMNKNQKIDKSAQYLCFRTKKEGDSPNNKRKIYFTCHPDDFDLYFNKVCNDIFETQDCAIYYTKNMGAPIPKKYLESDLGQMNLFVVPITFKLLTEKNRAIDFDIKYASNNDISIPILPLMMEDGINELYDKHFGGRQYICPFSHDLTALRYEDKLKKYLSSILLSNETIKEIRKNFDAHIFISYRKKDRNHANELMKLIHKNPEFRNIAIWYDEFLTPGEYFENEINEALAASDLFALLVTPNLISEENYIQNVEYPLAKKNGKTILPIEFEKTNKKELEQQYPKIPECINSKDRSALNTSIFEALKTMCLQTKNEGPEHCYLIGLAYLDGIDVEVNVPYGVELIKRAANKKYILAMTKLYEMYNYGSYVHVDYNEAFKWAKRIYKHNLSLYGEDSLDTIDSLNSLGVQYSHFLGSHEKAKSAFRKAYCLSSKIRGPNHLETINYLENLAIESQGLGAIVEKPTDLKNALQLQQKVYDAKSKILGPNHPDTIKSLINLASAHFNLFNSKKAVKLLLKAYKLGLKAYDLNRYNIAICLSELALIYGDLGNHNGAIELLQKAYNLYDVLLGKHHPKTIACLSLLARQYEELKEFDKSIELLLMAYNQNLKIYGPNHSEIFNSLLDLAHIYDKAGRYDKSAKIYEKLNKL